MNILYIATVRMPNEKASGLAIARQCEAFASADNTVVLAFPYLKNRIKGNIFDYYNLKRNFNTVVIPCIDIVNTGRWGFLITRFFQMIVLFVYTILHQKNFDIIYARDEWMLMLPIFFLHKKKTIIWETHTKHNNFIVRYVVRNADIIVAISRGLQNFYNKLSDRVDILVEPSGVDLGQFKNPLTHLEARERLGLPKDKIIVGYIGKYTTMGEEKGVDELIEAFAEASKVNDKLHLLIVGLEEYEKETVLSLCESVDLSKNFYSLLPLEQKNFATYLQASDVLVMNYPDTEHYRLYMSPTKLFAYMASGKVIISSDLPSVREIVDETMVVYIKPGDTVNLKLSLLRICNDLSGFNHLSEKAKKEVMKYGWDSRTDHIVDKIKLRTLI